jgi:hypothetical protein
LNMINALFVNSHLNRLVQNAKNLEIVVFQVILS